MLRGVLIRAVFMKKSTITMKNILCMSTSKKKNNNNCPNNDARTQIKLRDLRRKKTTKAEGLLAFTSDCLCDDLH